MIIPWQELENDTLTNIIESFILREGTDYGLVEKTLAEKVADIRKQLQQGSIVIVWSELHETINLKNINELNY